MGLERDSRWISGTCWCWKGSEDPSAAPSQGTAGRCCEQELCVQPGTGERFTRALSQSLLSSTLSFKSFRVLLPAGK